MSKLDDGLRADQALYDTADKALQMLRDELLRRATMANDYAGVIRFSDELIRYGGRNIARVVGFPAAAEHTYRVADDLVATPLKEIGI